MQSGVGFLTKMTGLTWPKKHRELPGGKPPYDAVIHRSVYERFDAPEVLQYDISLPYRPTTLAQHIDFMDGFSGRGSESEARLRSRLR